MRFSSVSRTLLPWMTFALLSILAFPGCGDDDDDNPVNPGPSTQLTGTFANPNEGGMMTITIQSASLAPARRAGSAASHASTATAVLTPEIGAPVHLTGTYSDESDTLYLSGGGLSYNMRGVYDATASTILGSYAGPQGNGYFACVVGGTGAVDVYCGTFEDDEDISHGRWNLVISGTQLQGIGALYGGLFYRFSGTATGTGATRVIAVEDEIGVGNTLTADGTLDTGTSLAQGTWTVSSNGVPYNTGPWSAAPCETGGQTTELTGTFITDSGSGFVSITTASSLLAPGRPAPSLGTHAVPATAWLAGEGLGTATLSGFYDPETDSLGLVGMPLHTMVGKYDESGAVAGIFGRYTHAAEQGFFQSAVGNADAVQPLCGSFENQAQTVSGPWTLVVAGTSATGMAISAEGVEILFEGTVTGTGAARTVTLTGSDGQGGTLTATGTLDATTDRVTDGTWSLEVDSTPVDSGTWGAELCLVPVAP
jgi:hypothetical protein